VILRGLGNRLSLILMQREKPWVGEPGARFRTSFTKLALPPGLLVRL